MPILNPGALKIGYVILVASPKPAIRAFQQKAGYGENSRWTHVVGGLGGYDAVGAYIPRSRVVNLQKEYAAKGTEIKVMRRNGQPEHKRYKVALWWATMNNLPYDALPGIVRGSKRYPAPRLNPKIDVKKEARL